MKWTWILAASLSLVWAGCQMEDSRKETTVGEETNTQVVGASDERQSETAVDAPVMESASGTPMVEGSGAGSNATEGTTSSKMVKKETTPAAPKEMVYRDVTQLDVAPLYPGGESAMRKYVRDNLQYPEVAKNNGHEGTVYVEFQVSKTGKVENARIDKGVNAALNKEALRVVRSMPAWEPGKKGRNNVRVQYVLPVVFEIRGGSTGSVYPVTNDTI